MARMPSEKTRLDRIAKNIAKLPRKHVQNIKKAARSAEIVRHATGTESGTPPGGRQARKIKKK